MKQKILIYTTFILYIICVLSILTFIVTGRKIDRKSKLIALKSSFKNEIAIVNISGPISLNLQPRKIFAYGSGDIVNKLRILGKKDSVKAIILRINSPGGSVAAVQEIYSEVMRLRQKGKIVITSMGDVAASGGYYVASACDKIVANPGSITGSIGVILQIGNIEELFKKIGVQTVVIKSGKFKDTGTMFRGITEDEKQIFQELINEAYNQFINAIVEGRKMEPDNVRKLADGRIFTGTQALKSGLIDKLGNDTDAINLAKELANISGEPKIITEIDPWDRLLGIFGETKTQTSVQEILNVRKLRFEYMLE